MHTSTRCRLQAWRHARDCASHHKQLPENLEEALDGLAVRESRAREDAPAGLVRAAAHLDRDGRQVVGDTLIRLLDSPDAHTRSLTAAPLASLASEHVWRRRCTEPSLQWWCGAPDQRRYDATVGWVHAVAHGADVIGELGRTSAVSAPILRDVVSRRLTHAAGTVWRDQEEDRLALAIAQVPLQDDLWEKAAPRWIKDLVPRVAVEGPPAPAATITTCRTLRCLYVLVDWPVPGTRNHCVRHSGEVQHQKRRLLEAVEPRTAA